MPEIGGVANLLVTLQEADFFRLIAPFVMSYIVFFLALLRLPLLGTDNSPASIDKRKYSSILSIIISSFVVYFLYQNPAYQMFFANYFGRIVIGLMGLLGFMTLVSFTGWDLGGIKQPLLGLIVIAIAVGSFGVAGGLSVYIPQATIPVLGMTLSQLYQYTLGSGLVWVIAVGVILYWVTTESEDSDGSRGLRWWTGAPTPTNLLTEEEAKDKYDNSQ